MSLFDNDDDFLESQIKEQEYKKQKKIAKQERLNRKKALIEEIKNTIQGADYDAKNFNQYVKNKVLFNDENKEDYKAQQTSQSVNTRYKKGSLEWALSVLNLEYFTNLEEAKRNYFNLAKQCHPDKSNNSNNDKMKELNEAWEIIKTRHQ